MIRTTLLIAAAAVSILSAQDASAGWLWGLSVPIPLGKPGNLCVAPSVKIGDVVRSPTHADAFLVITKIAGIARRRCTDPSNPILATAVPKA